jgi:hypothetical protein
MKLMRILHWPSLAIFLVVSIAGGLVAHEWLKIGFWGGFSLTAIGMIITGWIATVEDERPGGFNYPTADQIDRDKEKEG